MSASSAPANQAAPASDRSGWVSAARSPRTEAGAQAQNGLQPNRNPMFGRESPWRGQTRSGLCRHRPPPGRPRTDRHPQGDPAALPTSAGRGAVGFHRRQIDHPFAADVFVHLLRRGRIAGVLPRQAGLLRLPGGVAAAVPADGARRGSTHAPSGPVMASRSFGPRVAIRAAASWGGPANPRRPRR